MADVYPLGQVNLVVSDLERSRRFYGRCLHAELTAEGHRSRQDPVDAFWGSRYAIVEDPDGNLVGLKSPR